MTFTADQDSNGPAHIMVPAQSMDYDPITIGAQRVLNQYDMNLRNNSSALLDTNIIIYGSTAGQSPG